MERGKKNPDLGRLKKKENLNKGTYQSLTRLGFQVIQVLGEIHLSVHCRLFFGIKEITKRNF